MIAVMGATGRVGSQVVENLIKNGEQVLALGRDTARLEPLRQQGVGILTGDAKDPDYLREAFSRADAVFTLMPFDPHGTGIADQHRIIGESITTAVRQSGVGHVVFLSSIGGERSGGTGPIVALHQQEERLRALGVPTLVLRPGFFFENLRDMLGAIRDQGVAAGPIAPGVPLPMVSVKDIGRQAAEALAQRDWQAVQVREIPGPRDLTMNEATRMIGERINKPDLQYVQVPISQFVQILIDEAGYSREAAELECAVARAANVGLLASLHGRIAWGANWIPFEQFADELAAEYPPQAPVA